MTSVATKRIKNIKVIRPGSPPDVDSDFATYCRDDVLSHVEEVYGRGTLSNIITFSTLAAKGAFKTMCTIYQVPFAEANKIAALVPPPIEGVDCTLNDIFDSKSPRYTEGADFRAATAEEKWQPIIAGARAIEGRIKSTGVHPCFTGDTLVQTNSGFKPISKIEVGELVRTHKNKLQPVAEVMKRNANDLLLLRAANSAPVQVTGDHPFFVRSILRNEPESKRLEGSSRGLSEPYWKKAIDLEVKTDLIGVPINQNSSIPDFPGLPVEDPDFWWVMGRFLGDGWHEEWPSVQNRVRRNGEKYEYKRTEKRVIICYGKHEDSTELLAKVGKFFTYRLVEERTTFKINIKHDENFFEFVKLFGKLASGKRVPTFVQDLPVPLLEEFFLGYFSADGNDVPGSQSREFSTVSKELFLGMIAVINKVYGVHCLTTVEPRDTMVIEGRTVNCKDRYHARWAREKKVKDHSFVEEGYVWASIVEVNDLKEEAEVFNLSVVDDNSYTANNLIAHNCGVVISSQPLTETIPLQVRQDDGRVIAQWNYPELESLGLIKFDFLGLDTVDLIQHSVEYIRENGKTPPSMMEIVHGPMDDKKTYEMLGRGDTIGVFQLASPGVQDLLKKMKPNSLDDIAACTALYRPGPMGMNSHIKYADRKAGREKVEYPIHKEFKGSKLETILEKTFSLIVYQEQILQISNQVCGMTLQEGDDLRSAMGKKKIKVMLAMKPKFIEGGKANGFSDEAMNTLWDTCEEFARYGFNYSHSVAYALNAYQSAYLKANYPVEFMAALIAQNVDSKDKTLNFLQEAKKMGLKVGSADINASDVNVAPDYLGTSEYDILFGLSGINAISKDTARIIVEERKKNGDFKSIQDVVKRCSAAGVSNKRVFENLSYAGAFDSFGVARRAIVENLPALLGDAKVQQTKGTSLFDMMGAQEEIHEVDFSSVSEYPHLEKLKLEAGVIGLYLSSHPLSNAGSLAGLRTSSIEQLLKSKEKAAVKIVGSLTSVVVKRQKRGGKSIAVTIDDGTGYVTAFLNKNIVKGLDKTAAQNKVKSLYCSGAEAVPSEIEDNVLLNEFSAVEELEIGSVYSVDMLFRPGFDDNPYAARVGEILKVELADDGKLPIRVRLIKPKDQAQKTHQAKIIKEAVRKHPGDFPVYIAYTPDNFEALLSAQEGTEYVDAIDAIKAGEEVLFRKIEQTTKKVSKASGRGSTLMGDKKDEQKNEPEVEAYRNWPPAPQNRGPLKKRSRRVDASSLTKLVRAIESLDYKKTRFTADKNQAISLFLESELGIENYDFGVLNADILIDD